MIDAYSFGRISIDQKIYVKDVIILPDRIQDSWWRKQGHLLLLEDILSAVVEAAPEFIVVGQGKFGMMKVHDEVREYLDDHNIPLHAEKSDQAIEMFNRLTGEGRRVLGAFHLTC